MRSFIFEVICVMRHWAIKKERPFTKHRHGRYWCPDGCGKKAVIDYNGSNIVYKCNGCNKRFTEQQMGEIN